MTYSVYPMIQFLHYVVSTYPSRMIKLRTPNFRAKLERKKINRNKVWTLTCKDYIDTAVENIEKQLAAKN